MKKYLILIGLLLAVSVSAAPASTILRNILPEATNTYDIGSTTPNSVWKNGYFQNLTVTGLTGQNCVGTDGSGLFQAGTCGGGGGAGSDFSYVVAPYGRYLTATSSVVGLLTPFTASSTLAKLTTVLSTSTQATTTYLKATTLNVGTLDGFGFFTTGNVTASTSIGQNYIAADIARDSELHNAVTLAGENYLTLSTQQITAGALGPTHLDALDFGDFTCNGTTCSLDATYVPTTRTLTVAGTANQLTSSAGAQDLSANRTWTLSLPSHIIFPSSFQVASASSTNATSTNLDITGLLTFNGVTGSTWTAFCTTITGSADLCDSNDATGGGGGAASDFTYTVAPYGRYLTPTSTVVGLLTNASSTLSNLTMVNSTTTNATTTNLTVTGTLDVDGLTSALTLTGAGGVFAEYTGTSCTNQFPRSLSALGAATCESVANADLTNSSFSTSLSGGILGSASVSLGGTLSLNVNIPSQLTYTVPPSTTVNSGLYLTPTSTAVGFLVGDTASSTFMRLTSRFSTTTEATTTYLNTTNLRINSQNFTSLLGSGLLNTAGVLTPDCATITGSADLCDGSDATGGGGGASFGTEFTYTVPPATGNSGLYLTPTSTSVGLLTFASSTMNKLSVNFGTTTQATSTSMYISSILSVGSTSPYATLSIMGSGNIVAFGTTTGANATSTFSMRYVQGTGVITELGDPFSTATSSFMKNGVNLVGGGCYAISGTCIGASASAGGSNTELQYNSGGSLAGLSGFTFAGSTLTMTSLFLVNNGSSTIVNLSMINSTTTNATSTLFSITTRASTTALTISGLGNTSTQCLQINNQGVVSATGSACGGGTANATIADSEDIWDITPQTDSMWFAPGGSFVDVLGENLLAIHQLESTSSAIYLRWHIPDRIASTSEATFYRNYTATTSGNAAFDVYATTTDATSGAYANFTWTLLEAGSTSPMTITGNTSYRGNTTSTPIGLTLTAGQDLVIKLTRIGADADDTVGNGTFLIKSWLRFAAKVN